MIKFFTFAHKRPDFIEMQVRSFEKYLREPFEITVFNNAAFDVDVDNSNYKIIGEVCEHMGAWCVDVARDENLIQRCQVLEDQVDRSGGSRVELFTATGEYINPNIACAYPLCWAWEKVISKERGPVCIIDSDMFMLQPFTLSDFTERYQLGFVPMSRPGGIEYMWNALVLADMDCLPEPEKINWWCGRVGDHSVDVGGQTYHYLRAHPELDVLSIRSERIFDADETGYEMLWLEDVRILHYLRGSNYNHQTDEYHRVKTQKFREMIGL